MDSFGEWRLLYAQVNGNVTISAPALGEQLTVSTSNQFAGAVSSIRWGNKEFINNWDHGRQLAANAYFFNRFECYNPYETGTQGRRVFPNQFQSIARNAGERQPAGEHNANGLVPIDSRTQARTYGDLCGDPGAWLACPGYTGPLSDYRMHKTVTIGFAGIPNVIEYLAELYIPEHVEKASNQITAVMPYEFSSVRTYDIVSKEYRNDTRAGGRRRQHQGGGNKRRQLCAWILLAGSAPAVRRWHRHRQLVVRCSAKPLSGPIRRITSVSTLGA